MAVLPSNTKAATVAGTTTNTQAGANGTDGKQEHLTYTLAEILAKKSTIPVKVAEIDYTEDAWERSAPPPRDIYQLRLFPTKDGYEPRKYNEKDPNSPMFFQAALECRIVSDNPEYNNIPVFYYASTRLPRGKNISTVLGLMIKAGAKIKATSLTDIDQIKFFDQFLTKEPIISAELDWRGSYLSGQDPKTGKNQYANVFNHYEEFPENPDGADAVRQHEITISKKDGTPVEIKAQLYIGKWMNKEEAGEYKKGEDGKGGTRGGSPVFVKRTEVEGKAGIVSAAPTSSIAPVVATIVAPVQPAVVVEESVEDMDLILEP